MAAKHAFEEEELPPPYSSVPGPSQLNSTSDSSSAGSGTSLFASHLTALHTTLKANQAIRATVQEENDNEALALIIPHIEALLSSIADMHPSPSLVEATVIPDRAIGLGWTLTERDEKLRGEIRKIIRVKKDEKCLSDVARGKKQSLAPSEQQTQAQDHGSEFDEWGRWKDSVDSDSYPQDTEHLLWWKDEDMAYRLAKYLRPERPAIRADGQTAQQSRPPKQAKSRWGFFKKEEPELAVSPVPAPSLGASSAAARRQPVEGVKMSIAAEEVTFRRENELGIWESRTGWGIVLAVAIKR